MPVTKEMIADAAIEMANAWSRYKAAEQAGSVFERRFASHALMVHDRVVDLVREYQRQPEAAPPTSSSHEPRV
jgi:hypothetical protein